MYNYLHCNCNKKKCSCDKCE